jgi:hypothetical protein
LISQRVSTTFINDSHVACPIYEKLCLQTPEGYYLVTDTAFLRGTDQITGHIKVPMKDGAHLPVDHAECENVMRHDCQLLSFRQTAKWGMRTMQGSFGWLR